MTVKLSPPTLLGVSARLQKWLNSLYVRVGEGPLKIQGYAKAALPTVADWGDTSTFSSLIYVTDEVGGPVLAFSDGTNWRRVTDRAIVS